MRVLRVLVCALLVVAGCQSVSLEKTVTVSGGEAYQAFTIDAPRRDQKVTVTISGATAPVNVYIVLEKDLAAAQDNLKIEKPPANALDKKENVQDATLEATVPANNSYTVLLSPIGGKTAQVNLKIKGR
jgi:hypothetical protein